MRNLSNPSGRHRYRRYRSPEWYQLRAEERRIAHLRWRASADPLDVEIHDKTAALCRSLALQLYGNGESEE